MSPHKDEHLDLCAGYVTGSLDREDLARLEDHLREGCALCRNVLRELGEASVLLAQSAPQVSPDPALRARVLDAFRAEAAARASERRPEVRGTSGPTIVPIRPPSRLVWSAAIGWAAAVVLAVTVGTFWETIARLREEIRAKDDRVTELGERLARERRWLAILSAPGAKVAEMKLTPEGKALQGRAVYDPASGRALVMLQNAIPPAGKDYQLWAIRGGKTVNLGVIPVDPSGLAAVPLEAVGDPRTTQAFAVSLEPKGGSPNPAAPSGPVVMMGALGG